MESNSSSILTQLILIMILTLTNAFFASAEMAIVSVNKTRIKKLAQEGHKKALLLEKLMSEPSNFLSTIQVGITLAGFFSSASAATGISGDLAKVLSQLGLPYPHEIAMIGVTILLSYFTLVFGELVPKRIALKKAEQIALSSVQIVYGLSIVAKPFIRILSFSSNIVLRLLGHNQKDVEEKVSKEEIKALVYELEQEGSIEDEEKQMIDAVFEFNDTPAKKIMTPRKDTFMIDVGDDINKTLDNLLSQNYSRVPIYEDSIDNIIGILYIRDLIFEARKVGFEHIQLRNLLHTPYFVSERKKVNELFKVLKEKKNHLAVLIDEYGGFAGIVTMEDIIEEIVGEIQDEYDQEDVDIRKIDNHTFLVKASLSLSQLGHGLHLTFPEGDCDTLNGYLITLLGEIPKDPITLSLDFAEFKILKVTNTKIETVQIKITK